MKRSAGDGWVLTETDESDPLVVLCSPDGRMLGCGHTDADEIERILVRKRMLFVRQQDGAITMFRLLSYLPHDFNPLRGLRSEARPIERAATYVQEAMEL